jgi:hypothetical protein
MSDTNITKIPSARVALLDPNTGLISREWFRFFNNLFVISGGAESGVAQIANGGTGASTAAQALINLGAGTVTRVRGNGIVNGITLTGDVTTDGVLNLGGSVIADLNNSTGTINVANQVYGVLAVANGGTGLAVRPTVATKAADFTLAADEGWIINNKSGSTCTVTLPAASSWVGRVVTFKNLQTQTLVSASSNVVPIGGTLAGTAILAASVGAWATLVSDGTNWVIMAS